MAEPPYGFSAPPWPSFVNPRRGRFEYDQAIAEQDVDRIHDAEIGAADGRGYADLSGSNVAHFGNRQCDAFIRLMSRLEDC